MSRKKKDKPLLENILIEDVAAEGNALAHVNGKVLFVPGMVPGDVVDVQVRRERKGYIDGYAARLVKPSEHRIEPVCEHFGVCGGCKWQCLPYEMQLDAKQRQAVDQLKRIGHLELPDISPIIGSDLQYYYRNKLEFTFSNRRWILPGEDPEALSDTERLGLGFHISGFFDKVLDLEKCHLMAEPCNEIRNFIRRYAVENGLSFFDLRAQTGFLRNLILREASSGEIMLTVVFGPDAEQDRDNVTKMLEAISGQFGQISSLNYVINPKPNDTIGDLDVITFSGNDCIYEKMGDLKFKIGPKSFYQTNSAQAFKLYSVVR
ncbi:MAG: class I SAM-dependent RNA methyltransferase, partial [Bacteroidales bacterium]|nr:class I SAM-dependent RNA methyltransferase [Bacteroidales bacterium]